MQRLAPHSRELSPRALSPGPSSRLRRRLARVALCVVLLGPALTLGCASAGFRELPAAEAWTCDACQRPAEPPGGGLWEDGRAACAECRTEAVVELAEAEEVLAEARAGLADATEARIASEVGLVLHDTPGLQAAAAELAHPRLHAFCQIRERFRGEELVERTFTIHALRAQPRALLRGVLVHELFHVWQTEQGAPEDAAPAWREGAANWAQWRLHLARGERDWAERLERDDDAVYGRGFRRFRSYVDARGRASALDAVRRRRDF